MATGRLTCAACGAELKPLRRHCPGCGAERQLGDAGAAAAPPAGEEPHASERVMPGGMRTPSPPHPRPSRRLRRSISRPRTKAGAFPLFTRYQLILIGLGLGLLIFLLVVAFLVWRQERRDQMRAESRRAATARPRPPPRRRHGPGRVRARRRSTTRRSLPPSRRRSRLQPARRRALSSRSRTS